MHIRHGVMLLMMFGDLSLLVQGQLSVTDDHAKEALCQQWASNRHIRQIINKGHERASPCSCHRQEAELEHTYEQKGSCFTEYFYTDGVKQLCCYNTDGTLHMNKPGAGYLLVEKLSANISEAYQSCCHGSSDRTCHLFYDVNPSDDCSGYITPKYKSSGGDVHITTIDGVEYDFNGHGEYMFLKLDNESLEIQIRTDYLIPGNKDATIITAVAIRVNQTVLNIVLNRTSQEAVLFLNSTHSFVSSTRTRPIRQFPFFILPSSENTFYIVYQSRRGSLMIHVKAGDNLDIQLNPKGQIFYETAIGLAGSTINGYVLSRNSTTYSINSTEHDFYVFGESWSLRNEFDSAFSYKLTNGNFSVYNTHHTKPKFLEDLVRNLTALFPYSSAVKIDAYNKTCEGNKDCLLAIARTGDIHLGQLIMEELQKEITENTAPFFLTNWTKLLNISYEKTKQFVIDLKTLAGDKEDNVDQLQFTVQTTINDTDFSLDNGIFNFTHVSPSLRYMDIELRFVVLDHLNFTSHADVQILYCGCEKESQCNYNDVDLTGDKFQRVSCSCNDSLLQGEFCEIHIPPCNVTTCFENVTCNNNALNKDNPCGPCPSGYSGDGINCDVPDTTTTTTAVPVQQRSDIQCLPDSITVYLPEKLIPGNRNVTWREESCPVTFNVTHYTDTIRLSDCGTTVQIDENFITFSNDLIVHSADDTLTGKGDLTFGEDYETVIPVKCIYAREKNVTSGYAPIKQHVRFMERRYGQLDLSIEQYQTAGYKTLVPSTGYPRKVPLNDNIYLRVGLNFPAKDLRVKVDQCIATGTPSPTDANWHQLVKSGCPISPVRLLSNTTSQDVKFSFKAFDFRHNSTGFVYIHCEVTVCSSTDANCMMGCSRRTKRATSVNPFGGSHLLSTGPFVMEREEAENGAVTSTLVFAGVCLSLAVICVGIAILGWTRKSPRPHKVDTLM